MICPIVLKLSAMINLITVLDEVFQKHHIQESALLVVVLAEIKATQTLILNAASAGNEERFRSMQQTLSQDAAEVLVQILEQRFGRKVCDDFLRGAFPVN